MRVRVWVPMEVSVMVDMVLPEGHDPSKRAIYEAAVDKVLDIQCNDTSLTTLSKDDWKVSENEPMRGELDEIVEIW